VNKPRTRRGGAKAAPDKGGASQSESRRRHSCLCSWVGFCFFCHPDRSGPTSSSALLFSASGRVVEGPRQPTITDHLLSVPSALRPLCLCVNSSSSLKQKLMANSCQ